MEPSSSVRKTLPHIWRVANIVGLTAFSVWLVRFIILFAMLGDSIPAPARTLLGIALPGLCEAIKARNADPVKNYLDQGGNPNAIDASSTDLDGPTSVSLLGCAAWYGNREVAQMLLNRGAKINGTRWDRDQKSPPLTLALLAIDRDKTIVSSRQNREVAELLVVRGADVNVKNRFGVTPLHAIAMWHYRENAADRRAIAELLIAKGAEVNSKRSGNLINRFICDRYAVDVSGTSPLHLAAYYGQPSVAEVLIAKGADVAAKNDCDRTPLNIAARQGDSPALVETLLAQGSDSNAKDVLGQTPLFYATQSLGFLQRPGSNSEGKEERSTNLAVIIELLKRHGAQQK
ncbi:ankyrin repeat domain-containing protein [Trichocoleus desertorum AS-A10]|uniref:ankyrin repeat domain-containing protein n=1 Tax=Trichocoleus desertorum TaxID=1481672 RepID=UPI003298865F